MGSSITSPLAVVETVVRFPERSIARLPGAGLVDENGERLGTSAQAAQQRYGNVITAG